jgi:hypothetical protein
MLALVVAVQVAAFASHPEASLAGSNFEIDLDANLKVDDPSPSIDWASVNETRATDKVNGTGDDSYAGGVKEDTTCPSATTDSIPPNKSDLLSFSVYREQGSGTHPGFLNLAWSRVNDPTGTTLMDFEFNQSSTKCASGPNVVRTVGDKLIEYSIDQGGSRATMTIRNWTGSAWGPAQPISSNSVTCGNLPCAAGTINSSPIPAADSDGLISTGDMAPRTFGEAQIDLRLLFQPNKCTSFGSAMLKSRSSDSFTSQLKDFVAPVPLELQNCGQVIIRKQTDPQLGSNSPDFGYTKSFNTDPTSVNTFTLKDDGVKDYGKTVLFGSNYTVTEDVIPDNWAFTSLDCSASSNGTTFTTNGRTVTFDIDSDTDKLDCTYTNTLQTVASSMTTAQKFLPNDSATISAPSGGNLAGSVNFELFDNATCQGDTPIYTQNNVAVSGASPQTVSTSNTTVTVLTTANLSWKVSYDSTNPLQRDIPASCHESSDLTITNGGTVSSP